LQDVPWNRIEWDMADKRQAVSLAFANLTQTSQPN